MFFKRTERALEELINDQASTEDINREKRQQVQKLNNDVKDMDAKLSRADKSVIKKPSNKKRIRRSKFSI